MEKIAKTVKNTGIAEKVSHRKVVIPGHVAVLMRAAFSLEARSWGACSQFLASRTEKICSGIYSDECDERWDWYERRIELMYTTYRLKANDLNSQFLESLKTLFRDQEVEITVSTVDETAYLLKSEANGLRLREAITNINAGTDLSKFAWMTCNETCGWSKVAPLRTSQAGQTGAAET